MQQKANAVNEDIMAWIDEYNKNTKQPENLGDMLLAMLAETKGGEMDLEKKEAQIKAAHHAAEDAYWETLDEFFPGIARAGIAGDLAVQWNDTIDRVIRAALERREG